MMRKKCPVLGTVFILTLLASSCVTRPAVTPAVPDPGVFVLTIAHVNDAHSKLDPTLTRLTLFLDDTLKAKPVYVELGGFPRLVSAVKDTRTQGADALFLNAGDYFQGSLYYTKYLGEADVEFWNMMKPDAGTLGNHEFDKGLEALKSTLLDRAVFPIVSANVMPARPDISVESEMPQAIRVRPYVVKNFGKALVGIVGLTTTATPDISSPGKDVVFTDCLSAVSKAVGELTAQGVNKIVLLTHIGYQEDVSLAAALRGVDVIVGGHSHTLLGNFSSLGLKSSGPYPTAVKDRDGDTVLVVQAWQWGDVLGDLVVSFDAEGRVRTWEGRPKAVVGRSLFRVYDLPDLAGAAKRVQYQADPSGAVSVFEYDPADSKYDIPVKDDPGSTTDQYDAYRAVYGKLIAGLSADPAVMMESDDPAASAKLEAYAKGVRELREKMIATVLEDMNRGLNRGPGPLIADSMTWKTRAQIGIMNPGGVRTNLLQGPLSVAAVYELQPFGNTLVTVSLKGADVIKVFEDMIDFQIGGKAVDRFDPFVYVSGARFSLDPSRPKGERVSGVMVKDARGGESPLDPNAVYKVAVNNFMANGGDKNLTLSASAGKYDTGFVDAEAFLDYVQGKELADIKEKRITLVP